jgi:hypothetical protein
MASQGDVTVFICYRRSDSAAYAGRLYDFLTDTLDPKQVWLDVEDVHAGSGFTDAVSDAVARSDVLLAVIGPEWLTATDVGGRRLLDDPVDMVRLEIEHALANDIRVLPVLVDGAQMPLASDLPESLRPLVQRHAFEFHDGRFDEEAERLASFLEASEDERSPAADVRPPVEEAPRAEPTLEEARRPPTTVITEPERPLYVDENVQFTVYRPRSIQANRWSTLLAFAHLSERRADADPAEPDPLDEVRRQAEQVLGEDVDAFVDLTQDSAAGVPREGEITFLPTADGVVFNPASRTFKWLEAVHREEFRLRADRAILGQTLRGRLSVYLGVRLLAEISLQFAVAEAAANSKPPPLVEQARPYRRIFASYSHRDVHIAEQFERYAAVFGDRYLRDWIDLRAGENWSERLQDMIRQADVFQLFWSWNSIRSRNVRNEWEYALSLSRPNFVRPTYWEVPMPRDLASGLPPPALNALHFHRLPLGPTAAPPTPAPVEVFPEEVRLPPSEPPPPPPPASIGFPRGGGARSLMPLLIVAALILLAFALALTLAAPPGP